MSRNKIFNRNVELRGFESLSPTFIALLAIVDQHELCIHYGAEGDYNENFYGTEIDRLLRASKVNKGYVFETEKALTLVFLSECE